MNVLSSAFYQQDTVAVAEQLIGKMLVREIEGRILSGRIIETEAYREDDPASHSYRGLTERTRPMFEAGGIAYVYFIYGMYDCFNVVTEPAGTGCAVLIRALEPIEGVEGMWRSRFTGRPFDRRRIRELANGPGKICRALRITREDNGVSLTDGPIRILEDGNYNPRPVASSVRIGIKKGLERPWRFFEKGNPSVSSPGRRA